jgi:hypothetical protein
MVFPAITFSRIIGPPKVVARHRAAQKFPKNTPNSKTSNTTPSRAFNPAGTLLLGPNRIPSEGHVKNMAFVDQRCVKTLLFVSTKSSSL